MTVTLGRRPSRYADAATERGVFSANAMVLTPGGPKLLGEIKDRDLVVSHDQGTVMVVGRKRTAISSGRGNSPIRIAEIGTPPFCVSPITLFMANSLSYREKFGSEEVLVRAASLRNDDMGGIASVEETEFISISLQHSAMLYVNGFVCECSPASSGDDYHTGAAFASRPTRANKYPILSDEEASLLYDAAGGAANALKFFRWGNS